MANLRIRLKHNGADLVDTEILNECIEHTAISVDGEKLQCLDNFTLSERRAKCKVRLLNTNREFNDDIKSKLTDEGYLIQDAFKKNQITENVRAYVFSHKKLLEETSDTILFDRHFNNPDSQTWNNVCTLAPQSKTMLDIFYTMCEEGMTTSGLNFRYAGANYYYGYSNRSYSFHGYKFNYGFMQLIAFIARGVQIEYGLPTTTNLADTTVAFINYMNTLGNGIHYTETGQLLGDGISEYVASKRFEGKNLSLEMLFVPIAKHPDASALSRCDKILNYITDYMFTELNGWHENVDLSMTNLPLLNFPTNNVYLNQAVFLASIIKYEWYQAVKTELFEKNGNTEDCKLVGIGALGKYSYIPFAKTKETIIRRNINHVTYGHYNIFWPYNESPKNILCLKNSILGRFNPMFGKPQQETIATSNGHKTESGIPIGDPVVASEHLSQYNDEELFVPVLRTYSTRNNYFASIIGAEFVRQYIDNINYNEIAGTPSDNFMYMTQYDKLNWMYLDNLSCSETYTPDGGFVDNIPVFDPASSTDVDEYGMFVYKDYFNTFYTMEPSSLTNIILEITRGNDKIYTGVVDFNSVTISQKSIDFTATDGMGLLIENLKKLNGIVNFSQFDKGNMLIADQRAGITIRQFINMIIKNPFPYKPLSFPYSGDLFPIDVPEYKALDNKVLQDITPDDAFVIAVQKSKQLLYCDGAGIIRLSDTKIDADTEPIVIDTDDIISKNLEQSIDREKFNIDKLKLLAGYESFTPDIVRAYSQYRNQYSKTIHLNVVGNQSIKMLDKIELDGKVWTVLGIDYDIK